MERLQKLLQSIRSLPEETRRFLAGAGIAVAALLLIVSWSTTISSRLQTLSVDSTALAPPRAPEERVSSPLTGIAETIRNLAGIELPPAAGALKEVFAPEALELLRSASADAIVSLWRYVYDPFR